MSDWRARLEGRECEACGVKRGIFTVWFWRPAVARDGFGGPQTFPAKQFARARCIDTAACIARRHKREQRARLRSSRIFICDPPGKKAEREKAGHCGWCGEPMYWTNKAGVRGLDLRRSYHRAEWDERDCRSEVDSSYCFDARWALKYQARNAGQPELRCVDCDQVCWRDGDREHAHEWKEWQADHEIPLEDGGEHTLENLRCRCTDCHKAKTAREAVARASA